MTFARDDQLGASGASLYLEGGSLAAATNTLTTLSRPLLVGAPGGTLTASGRTDSLTVSGTIGVPPLGGAGGTLSLTGSGSVTLSGTISAATLVSSVSTLNLNEDWSSGAGSLALNAGSTAYFSTVNALPPSSTGKIVLNGGGVLNPTASSLTIATPIDVAGPSAVGGGIYVPSGDYLTLTGTLSGSGNLVFGGTGTTFLSSVSPFSGEMEIRSGTVALSGMTGVAGLTNLAQAQVDHGAELELNAFATGTPLGSASVLLNGGDMLLGAFTLGSDVGHGVGYTLDVEGTGSVSLGLGDGSPTRLTAVSGYPLLYRGSNLGGSSGNYTQVLFSNAAGSNGVIGGIVVGADADSSGVTGTGTSLAFYDSTYGVRPGVIGSADYVQAAALSNSGGTATSANFRISGAVATAPSGSGTTNTINSLTMASGSTLTLTGGSTLTLTSGTLFVEPNAGGVGATISLGDLSNGTPIKGGATGASAPLYLVTVGDLTDTGTITTASNDTDLHKRGGGTLTVNGLQTGTASYFGGTVYVDEGTLRLGSGFAAANLNREYLLNVAAGATLDTGSSYASGIVNLAYGATLNLGTPLGAPAGTASFAALEQTGGATPSLNGTITGTGSLSVGANGANTSVTFNGTNTFSGGLSVLNGASLTTTNAAGFGTGAVRFSTSGTVTFNGVGAGVTVPNEWDFQSSSQTLTFQTTTGGDTDGAPFAVASSALGAQDVTLSGNVVGVATGTPADNVTYLPGSGDTIHLAGTGSSFTGAVTLGSTSSGSTTGTVGITNAGVFGGASNEVVLGYTTLRIEGGSLSLPQPVLFIGNSIIDTNSSNLTLANLASPATKPAFGWSVEKNGAGTLTINGSEPANTYAGSVTINGGTLALTGLGGASGTGTGGYGSLAVNYGGTLTGGGTLGPNGASALYLYSGGAISPGITGVGNGIDTFTAGTFTWIRGGTLQFDLSSAASDQIDVANYFNPGSGSGSYLFSFRDDTGGAGLVSGTTYTLINFGTNGGFQPTDFTYTGLPAQWAGMFAFNGSSLVFTLTSAATPEPSAAALLLAAVGLNTGSALHRRRCQPRDPNRP